MLSRVRRQTLRLFVAMRALERRGCQILAAHAHVTPPVVVIDAPPAEGFRTYGFLPAPPGRLRVPVRCAAHRWGARIEWDSREPRA